MVNSSKIKIQNVHAPNNRASKYMGQKLIDSKDKQIKLQLEISTFLSGINRTSRQKMRMYIEESSNTIN